MISSVQSFFKAAAFGTAALVIAACQSPPTQSSAETKVDDRALPTLTAQADPSYQALQASKAQALSIGLNNKINGEPGAQYTNNVANQANPVVAALQALKECEQARTARTTKSSPCEIRRKGDDIIHSSAELTAGLAPDRPALLWRLTGPAASPSSGNVYIAGSIHVLKPSLLPPPSYLEALRTTETLVLEVDETALSPAELQALVAQYGTLPGGQTLSDLMAPADYQRLTAYTKGLGLPDTALRTLKPAMLLLQLGVLEYISMGYLSEAGVETVLRANNGERQILALETIEQQLAAATALPLNLQSELLLETLDEIHSASLDISDLVQAWLAGDVERLDKLFNDNTNASEAAQQWMNDLLNKRNIGMAAGVAELLHTEEDYLVVVGAAHLVGDNSVLALLKQQGVSATRLQHDSLQKAPQ